MAYQFSYSICPECGATVADNWYIRHVRSGCKIGASKSGLPPIAANVAITPAGDDDSTSRRAAEPVR